jgi:hypothetical protein
MHSIKNQISFSNKKIRKETRIQCIDLLFEKLILNVLNLIAANSIIDWFLDKILISGRQ